MVETLARIFEAGPKRVFSVAALSAAIREDVNIDSVHRHHNLGPNRSLRSRHNRGEAIHITCGFGKDKPSYLNQFKYGLRFGNRKVHSSAVRMCIC